MNEYEYGNRQRSLELAIESTAPLEHAKDIVDRAQLFYDYLASADEQHPGDPKKS